MKVSESFGLRKVLDGNWFGVEIELCGENFSSVKGWSTTHDGSLGHNGIEYVMSEPLKISGTFSALQSIEKAAKELNWRVEDSVRAGVHVHMNVSDLTMKQVYNIIVMYMIFETSLIEWCGETRVGNLFCLPCREAEGWLYFLMNAAQRGNWDALTNDDCRYASLNTCPLSKFGTIEFRAMKATTDSSLIKAWIKMLYKIRKAALDYDNPIEIIGEFSALGPVEMARKVFEKNFDRIDNPNLSTQMVEGMRYAQDIAFCVENWDKLKEKPKPKRAEEKELIEQGRRVFEGIAGRPLRINPGRGEGFRAEPAPEPDPQPGSRAWRLNFGRNFIVGGQYDRPTVRPSFRYSEDRTESHNLRNGLGLGRLGMAELDKDQELRSLYINFLKRVSDRNARIAGER